MIVYLVSRSEPYEGKDIERVFLQEDAANAYRDKQNDRNRKSYGPAYKVEDVYEVIPFMVTE